MAVRGSRQAGANAQSFREGFAKSCDRLSASLGYISERWENRLTLNEVMRAENYFKGRFGIVLHARGLFEAAAWLAYFPRIFR